MLGAVRQWGQKRAPGIVHLRRPQQARDSAEEQSRRPAGPGWRAPRAADTVRRPPARRSPRSRPAAPAPARRRSEALWGTGQSVAAARPRLTPGARARSAHTGAPARGCGRGKGRTERRRAHVTAPSQAPAPHPRPAPTARRWPAAAGRFSTAARPRSPEAVANDILSRHPASPLWLAVTRGGSYTPAVGPGIVGSRPMWMASLSGFEQGGSLKTCPDFAHKSRSEGRRLLRRSWLLRPLLVRRNAWRGGCCSPTLADGRSRSPGQPPRRGGSGLQKEPAVARSGGSLSSAPSVSWGGSAAAGGPRCARFPPRLASVRPARTSS